MKIKKYKSGLRIIHNEKTDIDVVNFNIFVNAGSTSEEPHEFGIAHFCEHMFFKSTHKHTYQEINTMLDETGTVSNAFTSHFRTCYYFKCLSSFMEKNIEIFSEMFFNKTFKSVDIKNEKNVVLEELKKSNDEPRKVSFINAYRALYKDTVLDHHILGTRKTISSFNANSLIDFKNKHYVPKNIVISCSGNISFENLEKMVKKHFASLFEGEYDGDFKTYEVVKKNQEKKYISKFKDNEQSKIDIMFEFGNLDDLDEYIAECYFALLGYGCSSKLFVKIREEQGLVYNIGSSMTGFGNNDLGYISLSTSYKKVSKALTGILEVLRDCANGKITTKELDIARNNYIAALVFSKESNYAISIENGTYLLKKNRVVSDKEIVDALNSITVEQVIDFAKKVYNCQAFIVSAVGKSTLKDLKTFKH